MSNHDDARQMFVRDACEPLSDAGLQNLIRETDAVRRDLQARPERAQEAAEIHAQTLILADVRDERRRLAEQVEDTLHPFIDLGEIPDADE